MEEEFVAVGDRKRKPETRGQIVLPLVDRLVDLGAVDQNLVVVPGREKLETKTTVDDHAFVLPFVLDVEGRFWFCGRLAHRVLTADGPMYTVPCEAVFNCHADVYRSALVGVGPAGRQRPVIVLEPLPGRVPQNEGERDALFDEIRDLGRANPLTAPIEDFLIHAAFPVDIRHNAKIFREKLALWAADQLSDK